MGAPMCPRDRAGDLSYFAADRAARTRASDAIAVAAYERALAVCCQHYGVEVPAARSPNRHQHFANGYSYPMAGRARRLALYLAHVEAGCDLRAVARVSGLAASTVLHHVRRVEELRDCPQFDVLINALASCVAGQGERLAA